MKERRSPADLKDGVLCASRSLVCGQSTYLAPLARSASRVIPHLFARLWRFAIVHRGPLLWLITKWRKVEAPDACKRGHWLSARDVVAATQGSYSLPKCALCDQRVPLWSNDGEGLADLADEPPVW